MADTSENTSYSQHLEDWVKKEKAAVDLISAVGQLLYDRAIELVLFRTHLVDKSVSEVLQQHIYAKRVAGKTIEVVETADMAQEILKLDLAPAKLDVGLLTAEWQETKEQFE